MACPSSLDRVLLNVPTPSLLSPCPNCFFFSALPEHLLPAFFTLIHLQSCFSIRIIFPTANLRFSDIVTSCQVVFRAPAVWLAIILVQFQNSSIFLIAFPLLCFPSSRIIVSLFVGVLRFFPASPSPSYHSHYTPPPICPSTFASPFNYGNCVSRLRYLLS